MHMYDQLLTNINHYSKKKIIWALTEVTDNYNSKQANNLFYKLYCLYEI